MKLIDISTKVQKSFYNEILSVEDMTDNYIEQVKKLVQDPDKLVLKEIKLADGYYGIDGCHRLLVEFVFKSNYEEIIGQVLYHVETDKEFNVNGYGAFGDLKIVSNKYVLE